jgi:hypothetical protein
VSRWLPEPLRISLASDQVVLEHLKYDLKPNGFVPRLLRRQVLATRSGARGAGWDGALRVLAGELDSWGDHRCGVSVILGNSLVRYVLVPGSGQLSPPEEAGVLRHYFQEIYGEVAGQWELRTCSVPGASLQPACGVDNALLDALHALFGPGRLRLQSIQPRLMAVCNEHRAGIGDGTAWLLLVEPGNLCLGLVAGGVLTHLRSLRISGNWAVELPDLLDRESCLAEPSEEPGEILLWTREYMTPADLPATSIPLRLLQDRHLAGPVASAAVLATA